MKLAARVLLAAALACFAATALASDDPTGGLAGVVDITPENFDSIVKSGKHILLEFYAPWCGHCKRMTPEYKKLGEAVEGDAKLKSRVVIAKVNADEHRSIGEKFGVAGFPTVKWLARGKPATKEGAVNYEGPRSADKFLEFIAKKLEEDAGFARVADLDAFAAKFAAAAKEPERAKVLAEAEAVAAKVGADAKANAGLYVKFMAKYVKDGKAALAKEAARLERMIGSGSVAAAKVDEMSRKTSVLGAFLEASK